MKKLDIYSDAKKQIERHLAKLITEHHFNNEEAGYEVLLVENQKVIFKIHFKLCKMVELQFHKLYDNERKKAQFVREGDKRFTVTLQTGGDESYIFANLLENVIRELDEEKKIRVNQGKDLIMQASENYNPKKKLAKHPKVWYKKGLFHAQFILNSMKIEIVNSDPQVVAREILEKLPEFE